MVTGAAGLYGFHTVSELLKNENISKVIGVDNFSRNFLNKKILDSLVDPQKKFQSILQNYSTISKKQIDILGVDAIIHYAACVSIDESMVDQQKYFKNNE